MIGTRGARPHDLKLKCLKYYIMTNANKKNRKITSRFIVWFTNDIIYRLSSLLFCVLMHLYYTYYYNIYYIYITFYRLWKFWHFECFYFLVSKTRKRRNIKAISISISIVVSAILFIIFVFSILLRRKKLMGTKPRTMVKFSSKAFDLTKWNIYI